MGAQRTANLLAYCAEQDAKKHEVGTFRRLIADLRVVHWSTVEAVLHKIGVK